MTQKHAGRHERASAFSVRDWPLWRKVVLALAIPLLLAATFGGIRVRSDLRAAANSSTSAKQVTVLEPAVAYLKAAEQAAVAAQDDSAASKAALSTAQEDLNKAAGQLAQARDSSDLTEDQRYQVDVILDLSRAMRETGGEALSPGTWIAQVRELQSGVTQLITTIADAQINPEPRLELLSQTLAGRFSLAMQQALVATPRSGATGSQELYAELGVEGAAIDRLASAIGDTEPSIATLQTANAERSRTVRTGGTDLGGPDAYTEYDALITNLQDQVDRSLADSADTARRDALVNAAITAAALLVAILLALLVSRLLVRPIRKVREGARDVAHEQLPEAVAALRAGEEPAPIRPIDVTTKEEVGQLARAVDDLHRQAVRLASGEARLRSQVSEMFVTLSRRNTSLVNQQLGLIETLEKDEEDPERLESLFRLDHLAARMRRTADSLLVLADAPGRATGQDGLTVADALQAASSGVQDYQRVSVGATSSARIANEAAADVVHLLTELVDNALAYSPPTGTVRLESRSTPDGVAVEVSDSGLGIADGRLEELNQRLRSGGEVTPDTARRMGLFVVSRLARRHGITASLARNAEQGVTATVVLPPAILDQPVASPAPTEVPGQRAPAPEPAGRTEVLAPPGGLPTRRPGASLEAAGLTVPPPTSPLFESEPGTSPLDGPVTLDETSPIFAELQSAWLGGGDRVGWQSSEIEAGWERAERVAKADAPVNAAGLPVRTPGSMLVPGSVTKPTSKTRDPETVRARLAAHAAGVSRGRSATGKHTRPTEAGPA